MNQRVLYHSGTGDGVAVVLYRSVVVEQVSMEVLSLLQTLSNAPHMGDRHTYALHCAGHWCTRG